MRLLYFPSRSVATLFIFLFPFLTASSTVLAARPILADTVQILPGSTSVLTTPFLPALPLPAATVLLAPCTPVYGTGCNSYNIGMSGFTVNTTILSQNNGCGTSSYSSFTAVTAAVTPSQSCSFTVALSSGYQQGIAIWGDANHNDTFETGELLYQSASSNLTGNVSGTFTIPANALPGPMPVRVRSVGFNTVNDPCSYQEYGEVEDYALIVAGCAAPGALVTTVQSGSAAQLSWTGYGTVASYTLQWRPQGSSTFTTVSGLTNPTYTLPSLTPNTNYEWQVSSVCSATATSTPSTLQTFRTECTVPINTATNAIQISSADLTWMPGATVPASYNVQWRKQGSSTWSAPISVTATTYSLSSLTGDTAYQWQVQAVCAQAFTSTYTAPTTFTTQPCTNPASNLTANANFTSAALSWSSGSYYTNQFIVSYRTQGSTTWTPVSATVTEQYYSANYNLTGLAGNTAYEWAVARVCSAIESSTLSAPSTFTTVCSIPTSPSTSSIYPGNASLYWYGATGYQNYQIRWRKQGSTVWNTDNVTGQNSTYTPYSLTGLTSSTAYEWGVAQVCSASATSTFTNSLSFTTPACLNTATSLGATANYSSANLSWTNSAFTNYDFAVRYRTQGTTTWTNTPQPISGCCSINYNLTVLSPNTAYEWGVARVCSPTESSTYTAPATFTTVCPTPLSPYTNTVLPASAQLNWSGPSGNSGVTYTYEVQYRAVDNNVCTGNTTQSSNLWLTWPTVTTNGLSLTGLTSNTCYQWRVHSVCNGTDGGGYTTPISFKTPACTNTASSLAATPGFDKANLTWNNTAFSYYDFAVLYRTQGTTTWTTASPITQAYSSAYYSLTGLNGNTPYDWTVVRVCSATESSTIVTPASFTTSCKAPQSITTYNVGPVSALLYWDDPVNTGAYQVQWRQQGSTTWPYSLTLSSYQYLTGLTPGTAYEWQVRTICSASASSSFVGPGTFTTTSCPIPSTPYTTSIFSNSASLAWNTTADGVTYNLQWRPQSSSTWTTIPGLTSPPYGLTGLINNTAYIFQIQTVCTPSSSSSYSSPASFTTVCALPTNGTETARIVSASLSWNNPNTTFEVNWRQQGSTPWTSLTTTIGGSSFKPYSLSGLTPATAYEWQVRTVCTATDYSPTTAIRSFTTSACDTPASLYTNYVFATSAQLHWYSTYDAYETFRIQWRPQGSTTWNTINAVPPGVDSYALYDLTGLDPGTAYQWQVQKVCTQAISSAYAGPDNFTTTACGTPTNLYVTPAANYANLQWTGPAVGALYEVQWRQQGSTTWNTISNVLGNASYLVTINYQLSGLSPTTAYEYRVRTLCTGTSSSTFTAPSSFTTTGCQTPSSVYAATQTATTALLIWSQAGSSYNLRYRPQGSTAWTVVNGIAATAYLVEGLTPSSSYEFQVQTVCSTSSTSGFSSSSNFYTSGCSTPILAQAQVAPTAARLAWSATGTSYEVQYRAMPAGACLSNTTSPANPWTSAATGLTTNAFALSGLTAGSCYQWRVITTCSSTTFSSATGYFTTGCGSAPHGLTNMPVTGTTAQLNWNDFGGGTQYEVQWRANTNNAQTGDGGCVNNTTGAANPWNTISNVSGSNTTLTGLNLSTCYQWRIRVLCDGSMYSDILSFRTTSTPPACQSIVITQQPPVSATATVGSTVSVSVVATGTPPLTYQWYKAGTAAGNIVAGQTAATLSLTNVQVSQAGSYSCLITNSCDTEWSNGFTLALCQPVAITQQPPAAATATVGSTVSASLVATGSPTLTYQWYKASTAAGNAVAGQTSATLSLTNVQVSQSATYYAVVSNSCSSTVSNGFALSVSVACQPVTITQQPPLSGTATVGATVTASVVATGTAPLTYQWYKGSTAAGNAVAGQATASLSLTNVQVSQSGTYLCVVSNSCSSTVSNGFALSVSVACQPVTITQQPPATGTATVGTTVSVSLVATGSGPITYQWYKGTTAAGNVVAGQPSAALSLTNVQASQAGTYIAVVTNSCGTTVSTGFVLTVNTAPCNGGFYTIQNGSWSDPATWSCGQIPTAADAVEIRHTVSIPTSPVNYTGLALKITFTATGKLTFGATGKLKVGP